MEMFEAVNVSNELQNKRQNGLQAKKCKSRAHCDAVWLYEKERFALFYNNAHDCDHCAQIAVFQSLFSLFFSFSLSLALDGNVQWPMF